MKNLEITKIEKLCNLANELKNGECYEEAFEYYQEAEKELIESIDSRIISISSVDKYLTNILIGYQSIGEYDKLQHLQEKYSQYFSKSEQCNKDIIQENYLSEYINNLTKNPMYHAKTAERKI